MRSTRQMHDAGILSEHIANCLVMPDVRVLCVIGGPGTGKTRAIRAWLAQVEQSQVLSAAYIDCKELAWGKSNALVRDEVTSNHPRGHYPMFVMNGEDVVVIDEAQMDAELVNRIAVHTSKERSAYTHSLLVLIFQYKEELAKFDLPIKETLICDADGILCQA